MGYSKANKKKTALRDGNSRARWNWSKYVIWIFMLLLCAAVLVVAFCCLLADSEDLTSGREDGRKSVSSRIVSNTPPPKPARSRIVEPPIQIIEEADSPVDLPLIDLKNWYAIYHDSNVTQVKKERLFDDLVHIALPAKLLTTHIHALKNYLATEYTSFYWVPYPDGITCIVRDVRDFSDFIQLELTIKDQDMEKRVKDYYASCGQVTERSGFSEFSRKYFSIVFSKEHPQYAMMSDLNKGDYVMSKDWGNLFVINTALKGSVTSLRANSMIEKSSLFDINFGILKAVQAESDLIRKAMSE